MRTPSRPGGQRNEPAYVRHVTERLAKVRGLLPESLADTTTANAVLLFGLQPHDWFDRQRNLSHNVGRPELAGTCPHKDSNRPNRKEGK